MTLLEEFENLCKYIREVTGSDLVCGLCEYDAGTVGEEPIECPGFDSNECFKLKESFKQKFPGYNGHEVIRCRDCKYYREDGDCWHEWDNDGRIYYQSIINEPSPDDYCSRAERKDDIVIIHPEDIVFNSEEDEKAYYESSGEERKDNE